MPHALTKQLYTNMKTKSFILVFIFMGLIVISARSENDMDIKFKPTKDSFFIGEPVIVICTISNLSDHVINLNFGSDGTNKFTFSSNGGEKQAIPALEDGGTSGSLLNVQLKPDEVYRRWIALDKWSLSLNSGLNSATGVFNNHGVEITGEFEIKLVASTEAQLGTVLGALIGEAGAATNAEEQSVLLEALHVKAKQSTDIKSILTKQEIFLKDIINNANVKVID